MPTVSIIITAFNRAYLITKAITSILEQNYCDFEIIIVDDASTDNTREVVAQIKDRRIRYVHHVENRGWPAARETGFAQAKGSYIAFCDSDDWWYPEKLSKQMAVFEQSPEADFIFTNGYYQKMDQLLFKTDKDSGLIPQGEEHFPLRDIVTLPSSWIFKRKILNEVNTFDRDILVWEDGDFFVRVADRFRVYFLNEPLVFWYSPQENFKPLRELTGRERFLKKHRGRMSRDPGYLFRFVKTLGKDYLRHAKPRQARQYLRQAFLMRPLDFSVWSKTFKSFGMKEKAEIHS